MAFRIAYFGLPLGALCLMKAGFALSLAVLPPIGAPGRRRLRRTRSFPLLDAGELGDPLDATVSELFARDPPDLVVSWFWTRKLPPEWLGRARLGGIGVHPSLLPRHRGRDPYFWTIDSGDLETGVSVHRLETEYDTGAVLRRERMPVGERNAWQLARALDRPSLRVLGEVVRELSTGRRLAAEEQDESRSTLAPEPSGPELSVDFAASSERVLRRIRALSPVPGLPLELWGICFFITAARPAEGFVPALLPGEAQLLADRLVLRTGDGAIAVERAAVVDADEETRVVNGAELTAELLGRLMSR